MQLELRTAAMLALVALAACSPSATQPATAPAQPPAQQPAPVAAPGETPAAPAPAKETPMPAEPNLYALNAPALDGKTVDLGQYRGKVALVVNVASECGYTPQYAGLEKLSKDYAAKGLVVLGFPSNEFGGQEPGTAADIQSFCTTKYGVTFPLFAKVETKKGAGQSPVYAYLTTAADAEPNWNFCKYLVGKDGKVLKFWKSRTAPDSAELLAAIDAALK